MLRFIEGRAGSGKTEYIRQMAADYAAQGVPVFLIVPKQYSFETERALLFQLGAQQAGKIEVLSFARMLNRIQHEFGGTVGKRLDDCGRSIYMSMALENVRRELSLYGKQFRNPDFIALMIKTMTECKMCGILPAMLAQTADHMTDGILRRKTDDVAKICAEYDRLISGGFVDPEDDMTVLCAELKEKPLFQNAVVLFDSFNRLTAQELGVVEQIFRQSQECFFTVCRDEDENDDFGLFADTVDLERRVARTARKSGISVGEPIVIRPSARFHNETLAQVEAQVFRSRPTVYEKEPDALELIEAANRYEECDAVARRIHRAVRERGMRYNDFVVILRSEADYAGILDSTFEKFGLPYFMDLPGSVESSAVMVTAVSALEAVLCGRRDASGDRLDTEAVLRCLKAGLLGLSAIEIAAVENYLFVWDIDKTDWFTEWSGHPDGFSAKQTEESDARLAQLNTFRTQITTRFRRLAEGMNAPSGLQKAEALYHFLADDDGGAFGTVQARMLRLSNELECTAFEQEMAAFCAAAERENAEKGAKMRALWQEVQDEDLHARQDAFWARLSETEGESLLEHRQAWEQSKRRCARPAEEQKRHWDLLMSVLNQAGLILQDYSPDGRAFLQLLQVAIANASLSYIPESLDCITVGSADRIRPASPREVFVIGANQGVFPAAPSTAGVFSDADRHKLTELGVELTETIDRQTVNERYSAYTALSSASEHLTVSYAVSESSGGAMLPSEIVSELHRVFPRLKTQSARRTPSEPEFIEEAFETLATHFDENSELRRVLYADFALQDAYGDTLRALARAEKMPVRFSSPSNAARFFNTDRMNLSASRVETFYQCPFRFFCRYGMRAAPMRKAKIDAIEYGTMIHSVLEKWLLCHPAKEELIALDAETVQKEIRALLEAYLETNFGGRAGKSKRFLHIYERYIAVAQELAEAMLADFRQNEFEPVDVELNIGSSGAEETPPERQIPSLELPLPGEGRVRVFGKVDRVDMMRTENGNYLRIVDYKTGTKEFALTDVLFGLDMQMIIYLLTITERGKERYGEVIPAGVLYVPARTAKMQALHGESEKVLDERRRKAMRMSGIVRDEDEVIRGMEPEVQGTFIPVKMKKDGSPDAHSQVIAPEEMNTLFAHVADKLQEMGMRLQAGEIPRQPMENVCKFCEFSGVCGHEPDDETLCIPKLSNSAVLEAMRQTQNRRKEEQ